MLSTMKTMEALQRMNQGEREEREFHDVLELKGFRIETDANGRPVSMQTLQIDINGMLVPGSGMAAPLPHALEVRTAEGIYAVVFPTSVRLWPGATPTTIGRLAVVAHRVLDGPVRFTMDGAAWSPSAS